MTEHIRIFSAHNANFDTAYIAVEDDANTFFSEHSYIETSTIGTHAYKDKDDRWVFTLVVVYKEKERTQAA